MFDKNRQMQYNQLAMNTQADLVKLSAESNMNVHQLQSAAQAQGAMMAAAEQTPHIEIPKVNFYPSVHPNPKKRRRQDIKQAYKLLKPMKRKWWSPRRWIGGKYRYNHNTTQCAVDGCDVGNLLQIVGNIYDDIRDEETGLSLWDKYFVDQVSGQPRAFLAREGVTSGRTLTATYCPEHLHLYDLLCQWEDEEEKAHETEKGTLKDKLKRGVSTVAVPIAAVRKSSNDNTPHQLVKYEEFFRMLKADGIPIQHFTNKETGMNDLTVIVFDQRQFARLGDNSPLLHAAPSVQPAVAQVGMLQDLIQENQVEFNAPAVPKP